MGWPRSRKEHLPALFLALLALPSAGEGRPAPDRQGCLLVTLCTGRTFRALFIGRREGRLAFQTPGGSPRLVDGRRVSRVRPCAALVLPCQGGTPREPEKERQARHLLTRLTSPRGRERAAAEARLLALGPAVRPILRKALFAAAPEVRLRARRVLARVERSFQRMASKRAR